MKSITHTHSYSVSDSDSDSLPSCYVYYSIFWRVCPDCCTFLAYFITLLCFGKIMNFTRYSPLLLLMFECILDTLARPLLLLLFAIFQRWALGPQRLPLNFPCPIPAHHHFPLSVCSFLLTLPLTLVVPSCQRENCNLIKLLDSAQFTIHAPANSPLYHAIFRVAVQIISIVEFAAFEVHN